MGKIDGLVKAYLEDNERFADAFNYFVYGGEQIVRPEELVSADATDVAVPPYGVAVQRHRDSLRGWHVKRDASATYALLGVESQTYVNYAMPVRVLLYDALVYASQVDEIARGHRREGRAGRTSAEFLSGFTREDYVAPVVTLVLHLGSEDWDGPTRLQAMLAPVDARLAAFVQDWRINVLSPAEVPSGDLSKFRSDLGMVLGYIRNSKDVSELGRMVEEDKRWRRFDRVAALLLNEVTHSDLAIGEGEGEVDMCEAIKEMRRLSREEGRKEGREEGREEGRREGRKEGRKEGREEGREEGRREEHKDTMRDVVAAMRQRGYDEDAIKAIVAAVEIGRGQSLPTDPSDN